MARTPGLHSMLAVGLCAMALTGCDELRSPPGPGVVCTTQFVYGLSVTVQDKATGQRICDAQVTAVSGSYRETLEPRGPSAECAYAGAGEREGVYALSAARTGYTPATKSNVRVDADRCHVIPARATLELDPAR
jgi:hypothetical protein